MGNIRTYKPHLSLIFVTLTCPLKLSLENGQPFEAIFSLGFQIWKPTGFQRVEILHVFCYISEYNFIETSQSSGGIFCSALRVDWCIFQFYLSDFPHLFSSMWMSSISTVAIQKSHSFRFVIKIIEGRS